MTILVVDAGNTRIKWAIFAQGVLDNAAQTERPPHSTDHFQTFAAQHWAPLAPPARVVVANVAGADFAETLAAWVKQTWHIEAEFVVPQRSACGIHNAYLEPQKLGVDRWAGMIAAHRAIQGGRGKKAKGPVCVIGCGTAITFDVLTANGEHQGGLIVPGLTLMRRALLENTQDILNKMGNAALGGDSSQTSLLARDTQGGVNGGTLYTVISVIDRVTTDLTAELGTGMTCIITGGDAPALLPLLADHYRHEPLLVLQGLAIIAQAASILPPYTSQDTQKPLHPETTVAPGILNPSLHSPATLAPDRMPKCGERRDAQEPPHPCAAVAPGILPPATLAHPCAAEDT